MTPWSSYKQAIIYIDIYTYIYVCCIINNILTDKVESDKENMADEENSDWLHKNDSSQRMQWNKHGLGVVFDYMMAISYYVVARNMFCKLIKNSNASNYTFMHDTRYLFNAQLKV